MAINFIKKDDLSHITRTTRQWETTVDRYEIIPKGVLCIELCNDKLTKIKIGDGHLRYELLPYVSGADLSNYYTKEETNNLIRDLKAIKIKGEASSLSDLPLRGNDEGDLWFVAKQDPDTHNRYDEYIWYKNKWESFGSSDIDLSEYAKKTYVDQHIQEVQNEITKIIESGYLHKHTNKEILDQTSAAYTSEKDQKLASLHNYDDTELRRLAHTHLNKNVLDQTDAVYNRDKDDKLAGLHNYDDTSVKQRLDDLESVSHTHENKEVLNRTTAAFTREQALILLDCKDFEGTDGTHPGTHGFVPAPTAADAGKVLGANGEWVANGSGDTVAEGGGISITTDQQTGVKTISVNVGDNLEIDNVTGELNVTGVDYSAGNGIRIGADYNFIEYIKNSGNYDQIILTDILPKFDDTLEVDIMFGAASGLDSNREFIGTCNYDGTSTVGDPFFYGMYVFNDNIRTSNITFYNHFVWTPQCTNTNFIDNPYGIDYYGNNPVRQIARMQGSTGSWGTVSRNFSDQYRSDFVDPFYPMAIFGSNHNNTELYQYICGEITLYGVKLYNSSNVLIHDLRPVERVSDNEAGLYDVITNKFYGNAGNGSFIKGPVVTTPDRIINAKIGDGLQIDSNGAIEVNVGDGLSINANDEVELDKATTSAIGGVIVGDNIDVNNGTISVPKAASNKPGVVKPSDGLSIDSNGVLSVDVGDGLSIDSTTKEVNVNVGDGLHIDSTDNKLKIQNGDGLSVDNNNDLNINAGDGLVIDSNDNTLNVNIGSGLEIDSVTGAINVIGGGNSGNYIEGEAIEFEEGASRLPTGYTELESISNTSASYIDTGYIPNTDTQLSIVANIHRGTTSWQTLFGARDAINPGGTEYAFFVRLNDNYNFYPRITGDTYTYMPNQTYDEKIEISIIGTTATVVKQNGTSYSYTQTGSLSNLSTTLAIFALHNQTGYVDNGIIDLYSFKIYENNVIVKEFVPCKRNSDDVIGLFDIINNVFYTNQGTGSFTAGRVVTLTSINVKYGNGLTLNASNEVEVNVGDGLFIDSTNNDVNIKIGQALSVNNSNEIDVNLGRALSINNNNEIDVDIATANSLGVVKIGDGIDIANDGTISVDEGYEYIAGEGIRIKNYDDMLPTGYTAVKALKSTGNQYINTGYIIKADTSFVMSCKIYQTSYGWAFPLGVRISSNAMMFCTEHWGDGSSIEYWLQDGNATATAAERAVFYNEPVIITIDDNVLTCVNQTTHDTVTLTVSGKTMPVDITIPLYVFATNDGGTTNFYGNMDLYNLKILEGGTVVHEYIPCLNDNNVAGLYDIYTDTFKTSPNGNAFTYISGTPTGDESIKKIELKKATTSTLGGVIVGDGLLIDTNGELEVKLGDGLTLDNNDAITLDTNTQLIINCVVVE